VAWPLVPFHLSFSGVYVVEHRMERRGYLMIDMPQHTLNYIGLHCIALLDNTSHHITSHYITLGCIIWHCNTLDSYHAHLYAYIYISVCYMYIYIYARVRVCIKVQQFKSCRSQCTPTTRCCRLFFEFPALCAAQGMALGIRAHLTEPMGMEVSPQGGYVLYMRYSYGHVQCTNTSSYMVILYNTIHIVTGLS
jgi:hypothetical protein